MHIRCFARTARLNMCRSYVLPNTKKILKHKRGLNLIFFGIGSKYHCKPLAEVFGRTKSTSILFCQVYANFPTLPLSLIIIWLLLNYYCNITNVVAYHYRVQCIRLKHLVYHSHVRNHYIYTTWSSFSFIQLLRKFHHEFFFLDVTPIFKVHG